MNLLKLLPGLTLLCAVGLGDDIRASVIQAQRNVVPFATVGLPLPKHPFPGQKKPLALLRAVGTHAWMGLACKRRPWLAPGPP